METPRIAMGWAAVLRLELPKCISELSGSKFFAVRGREGECVEVYLEVFS